MTPEVSVDGSDARNDELLKQTAGPKAGSLCISGMETSQGPAATLNKGFLEHDTRHFMNTLSWRWRESNPRLGERVLAGQRVGTPADLGFRLTGLDRHLPNSTEILGLSRVLGSYSGPAMVGVDRVLSSSSWSLSFA